MKLTKIALKHLIKEETKKLLREQYNNIPNTSPTCGGFPIVEVMYDGLPNFKLPMGTGDISSYQIPLGNFAFQYNQSPPATLDSLNTESEYILEPCTWGAGNNAIVYFKTINYVVGNMTNAAGTLGNPVYPEAGVNMSWVGGGGDSPAAEYEFQVANLNTTVYDVALPPLDQNIDNDIVFGDESLDTPPYQHIVGELEYCMCESPNPDYEGKDSVVGRPDDEVSYLDDNPLNDILTIDPAEQVFCEDFNTTNLNGALITYQIHPTNPWTQPYWGDPDEYPMGSQQGGWYLNPCNPNNWHYFFTGGDGDWHDSCTWQESYNYATIGGNPGPCWGGLPYMFFGNPGVGEFGTNAFLNMMCAYGSCYYKDEYPGGFLDFCCQSNLEAGIGGIGPSRPGDPQLEPLWGCTDPNAYNYDSYAAQNDNSCEYPPDISTVFYYNSESWSCVNPDCDFINMIQGASAEDLSSIKECSISINYPYEIYEAIPPSGTILDEGNLFTNMDDCCEAWFYSISLTIEGYYYSQNWDWFNDQTGGQPNIVEDYNSGNCASVTGDLSIELILGWDKQQSIPKDPGKQKLKRLAGIPNQNQTPQK